MGKRGEAVGGGGGGGEGEGAVAYPEGLLGCSSVPLQLNNTSQQKKTLVALVQQNSKVLMGGAAWSCQLIGHAVHAPVHNSMSTPYLKS